MFVASQAQKKADKVIGHTLKTIRKSNGLTQTQVAKRLHTSQKFVCQTENGKRSIRLTEAILYAYGVGTTPQKLYEQMKEALDQAGLLPPPRD